MVVKIKIIIS